MRKLTFILAFAVSMISTMTVSAQGRYGRDSAECIKYLSFYQQYMKQNNLNEAAPLWRKAMALCPPTANQNMLLDGMKILRKDLVQVKNDEARVKEIVDSLIMLHQMRIDYYPKYSVQANANLALDMLNYRLKIDPMGVYQRLGVIFEVAKGKTPVSVPVRYMDLVSQLYKNGAISAEDVMAAFQKASATLDLVAEAAKTDKEKADAAAAATDVEKIFSASGVASCENLVSIYGPQYAAAPDDKNLLKSMVATLSAQNCVEENLFRQAVESLHKQEPSYKSAYYLFRLYSSANDYDKAISYMEEAIGYPESDAQTDAGYYFEMAQYLYLKASRPAEAFRAAKACAAKAEEISDNALLGKTYFLIAQMWGSKKCDGNEVEVRAPYWVAVDYLVRAKNTNPELADEANKLIGSYSSYFPAQSDAFMYDVIDGASYTVDCGGMRETTKVRTQK